MNHIQGSAYRFENTCIAFGVFDGFHTGHKAVVETLISVAAEKSFRMEPFRGLVKPDLILSSATLANAFSRLLKSADEYAKKIILSIKIVTAKIDRARIIHIIEPPMRMYSKN